uniref:Hydroquinone glucosyltransferase n=1 Tax=Aegilops tauschii TaxID=37682 RepID=M8BA13_AEGTA
MAHAPHVVIVTSSGAGHVLPVSELAKRLAMHHGFTVTIVTYASLSSPGHSSPLASLPLGVSVAALPEVSIDDLPADAHLVTRILTVINRALPQLHDLLRSLLDLPAGITAFMTDMLCPAALTVGKEMGLPGYVFYTSSLMSLLSFLYIPELARTTTCECRDLPEPVLLPGAQTAELAAGLEASGQRFLWVVHHPNDKDSSAAYLGTAATDADPLTYLPDGFIERMNRTGLLVPLWAPQVEILTHVAVGGFMSHGGWNSTLETVAAGVPMVAWPLYAEQRMNAIGISSVGSAPLSDVLNAASAKALSVHKSIDLIEHLECMDLAIESDSLEVISACRGEFEVVAPYA